MAETTLRRLLLVRGPGDPAHLCLLPVTIDGFAEDLAHLSGFFCACGARFDADVSVLGFTTEYDLRCLMTSARQFEDRRRTA